MQAFCLAGTVGEKNVLRSEMHASPPRVTSVANMASVRRGQSLGGLALRARLLQLQGEVQPRVVQRLDAVSFAFMLR